MGKVQQVTNKFKTDPYQTTKTVEVEPSEESKSTSLSMPTDPATLAEIERQKQAAARAYGVNPQNGTPTPFEVLGYNPEDERKRREAERALNDRKRKENAWFNAFAVLGDSITAALGGNVWSRQPNNIGAKANADNARLIAEQKAEDEANKGKLRAASAGYADTVNKLIQNYLTKTVTTTKTGGSRTETTNHPAVTGFRQSSHVVGDGGSGNGGGGGGGRGIKYININTTDKDGKITKNRYDVTQQQYDALKGVLMEHYNNILNKGDEHSQTLMDYLTGAHVIKGVDSQGQYIYDEDQLLQNGYFWMLDDATRRRIERETDGKVRFKNRQVARSPQVWTGVEAQPEQPAEEQYDDD